MLDRTCRGCGGTVLADLGTFPWCNDCKRGVSVRSKSHANHAILGSLERMPAVPRGCVLQRGIILVAKAECNEEHRLGNVELYRRRVEARRRGLRPASLSLFASAPGDDLTHEEEDDGEEYNREPFARVG